MAIDPATLPMPVAPPMSATPTVDEIVRWNAYCEAVRHRADILNISVWRDADMAHKQTCSQLQTSFQALIEPTTNRIADAWDALDVALERLALALGAPAPKPPPYQLPL
jgi:hypothetical protein